MPQLVVSGSLAVIAAPMVRLAGGRTELQRGLRAGGDKVRTKVRRALRDQTNVTRYGVIVSHTSSHVAGLTYTIGGEGKGLPIDVFPVRATGRGVSADPWGVTHLFKRSFALLSGGFRARLTRKRFPIRKLYGPAISKEIVKDKSLAAFEEGVRTEVMPAIEATLRRLL